MDAALAALGLAAMLLALPANAKQPPGFVTSVKPYAVSCRF